MKETGAKEFNMPLTDEAFAVIRADFPLLNKLDLAYLDNSATSQKPRCVLEKEREYYESYNANPFRGLYGISTQATDAYEEARALTGGFIGAEPEEIVFTRNATESLNLVAYSYGDLVLHPGDEIITSVMEHHSNLLPWQQAAKRAGAAVKYLTPTSDGRFDLDQLAGMMNEHVKIVALSGMSNLFGTQVDLKEIAALVHRYDCVLVADGAQSVPHTHTDVLDLDVDFLAFSAHKMLGPMGVGVLYAKQDLLEKMPPFLSGGEMIQTVTLERVVYAGVPHKFEAGTVNAGGVIAFGEAIRYLQTLGTERIEAREEQLTTYAASKMTQIPGVHLLGSADPKDHHGILTFQVEGVHPHDVAAILNDDGIAVRAGHHCAQPLHKHLGIPSTTRASLMFYNTTQEIDRFIASLSQIRGKMGYSD